MFYRVDYTVALMLGGVALGLLFGKRCESVPSKRLADFYYLTIAILVGLRTVAFVMRLLAAQQPFWGTAGGVVGDLFGVVFGALFGLAARRKHGREILIEPAVLASLCVATSFTFAMAGVGKAFSMGPMSTFFTQSGYSVNFLKFITIAEIFGALGLLIPWTLPFALIGLAIDMFGAVLTHVHNGDPLNDSTGAIALLIRLAAIAILWTVRPRLQKPPIGARHAFARVTAAAIVCLAIAAGGSATLRHHAVTAAHFKTSS